MIRRKHLTRVGAVASLVLVAGLAAGLWGRYGHPPAEVRPPPGRPPAESLVGTWRLVNETFWAEPPPWSDAITEFAADGSLTTRVTFFTGPTEPQTGTYQLDGDILTCEVTSPPPMRRKYRTRLIKVDSTTLTTQELGGRYTSEYQRLE